MMMMMMMTTTMVVTVIVTAIIIRSGRLAVRLAHYYRFNHESIKTMF
jgi:hypothetical protein